MTEHIIKGVTLEFPSIFEPARNNFDDEPRYRTAFSYEGDKLKKLGAVRNGELELYNTISKYKPALKPKVKTMENFSKLDHLLTIAKNCNIHIENLFRGLKVDITIMLFNYEYEERSGVGLALLEIHVDLKKLEEKLLK